MSTPLQHSPAEIMRWLIVQLGLATSPVPWLSGLGDPWPAFVSNEPAQPDEVITVYDTTPVDDGRDMISGETYHHWGIQIRLRSNDYTVGRVRMERIHVALDEQVNMTTVTVPATKALDAVSYLVPCVSGTSIMSLGRETPTSKRVLFTLNCKMPIVSILPTS